MNLLVEGAGFGIPRLSFFPSYKHLNAYTHTYIYTLWLFNIAMENCPFIDGLPIKNADFPWLCQITRGYI